MTRGLRRAVAALRRGARADEGAVAVEAVLALPVLMFVYVAGFVWFDAFQTRNAAAQGAYTISDLLSRETTTVDDTYIDGLRTVFGHVTGTRNESWIRVSTLRCTDDCAVEEQRELALDWSYATDGHAALADGDLARYRERIPTLTLGERIIMVETFLPYSPAFDVGLPATTYSDLVMTSPRFAARIAWAGSS